jgi:hypothetical protein
MAVSGAILQAATQANTEADRAYASRRPQGAAMSGNQALFLIVVWFLWGLNIGFLLGWKTGKRTIADAPKENK